MADAYAALGKLLTAMQTAPNKAAVVAVLDELLSAEWQEGHDAGFKEGRDEGYRDGKATCADAGV